MLTKKEIFKLANYCVQYYLHNNYPSFYLTDTEWIQYLNKASHICLPDIYVNMIKVFSVRTNVINQMLLVSINFNLHKFKKIIKQVQVPIIIKFSLNTVLYIDLIKLMLLSYKPSESDKVNINKINFNIIDNSILNQCLYHLSSLYDYKNSKFNYNFFNMDYSVKKFIMALLEYYTNYNYYHVNDYINFATSTKISHLLFIIFNNALRVNNITDDLICSYFQLCKKLNIYDSKYLNNIFSFFKKHYLYNKIDTGIILMSGIIHNYYNYFNFSAEQKQELEFFFKKIKANQLLNNL